MYLGMNTWVRTFTNLNLNWVLKNIISVLIYFVLLKSKYMYIKLMFFYELVNSNHEMQMSLCKISSVTDDFSTIIIQPALENFLKKHSVLNK